MARTNRGSATRTIATVLVLALLAPVPTRAGEPGDRQVWNAAGIDALIAGTLAPDVDPADLFREDAAADDGLPTDLERLFQPPPTPPAPHRGKARRAPPPPEAPADPAQALADARRRFLSLPAERQAGLLQAHQARRQAREAAARRDRDRAALAETLATRARQVRELIRGELDVDVDPAPLLVLDLSAPWVAEAARPPAEPEGAAGAGTDPAPEVPPDATVDADPPVAAGRELLAALAAFQDRSTDERRALLERHVRRQAEAAEAAARRDQDASAQVQDEATRAAEERAQALQQAADAASQAARLAATERARLLGVREAQALFEADLLAREQQARERTERVDRLRAEVADLARRITWEEAPPTEASARWPEIRDALEAARTAFARSLDAYHAPRSQAPEVGEGADLSAVAEEDRAGLRELRDALRSEASRLGTLAARSRREAVETLARDVAVLDAARLELLDHVDPTLRKRLTGFGTAGLDQITGALGQIAMQARWRVDTLPQALTTARDRFWQAPLDAILALVYLAGLLVAFRWWRRRADGILERAALHWETRRPPGRLARVLAAGAWYLRRVRGPLEWLLLVVAVRLVAGEAARLPEARLAWLVLKWLLLAGLVIQGIDAVVARFVARTGAGAPESTQAAALRRRSLRLAGMLVIAIGLTLGAIREVLGRGTLYVWVLKTTWVLVLPAVVLMVRWWKPTVFVRVRARPRQGPLAAWILARPDGLRGFAAAAVGGAWLLAEGLYRFLLTQVAGVAAYRRAHAWLFRREVQRQAQLREQVEELPPIDAAAGGGGAPDGPAEPWIAGPVDAALAALAAKTGAESPHLAAVVGERGLGKTALLARLHRQAAADENLAITCPGSDFASLMSRIGTAVGLPGDAPEHAVRDALIRRNPPLVTIDDCQRLFCPTIGGLDVLSRLVETARTLPTRTTWVLALESPAWHFMSRARAPQPMFDRVFTLGAWTEPRIAELLSARTARAGLRPRFDALVHVEGAPPEAILGEEDRTQRGFHRMLWDFSGGNPAVALHFWRMSLRRGPDHAVQVALFDAPKAAAVEAMPLDALFVLRALIQMEQARAETLAEATRLPLHQVRDVLRFGADAGWLAQDDQVYRLTWQWYRTITRVLSRQHLLVI
jgi:hypothetical protein